LESSAVESGEEGGVRGNVKLGEDFVFRIVGAPIPV